MTTQTKPCTCGNKGLMVDIILHPCGCTVRRCDRCASRAMPEVLGPLVTVGQEAMHECGVVALLTTWRVAREVAL